jgi:diguanylate cyclase (GGDEF)-like protein/PAS domain S-box-containing protein
MDQEETRAEMLLRFGLLKRELRELEGRLDLGLDRRDPPVPPGVAPALLSLVAEHSVDLISVHAPNGDYVYASPNAERFFGWRPSQLEGNSAYEFFHPDDVERVARDHARHGKAHVSDLRYRLRTPSGDFKWVESRAVATQDGSFIVVITRDVQREQELIAELERMTRFDALTGLLNRRGLEEVLGHEIDRNGRYGTPVSVVLFDLDGFKSLNDARGHDAGDEALRAVGAVVTDKKRTCDAAGRWGGDEFLIVLPDTDPIRAVAFAERLRTAARHSLPVTLSLGIGGARPKDSIRELVDRADAALYAVKTRGGDGVVATPSHPVPHLVGH